MLILPETFGRREIVHRPFLDRLERLLAFTHEKSEMADW